MFGIPVGAIRIDKESHGTLRGNFAFINELPGQMELIPNEPQFIESGFDIVIGNPPYVRMEEIKHYKDRFRQWYKCFTGRADLYVYFYEAALALLRSDGVIAFITSNKYFRAAYGENLRNMLASRTRILNLIDFGDAAYSLPLPIRASLLLRRLHPMSN